MQSVDDIMNGTLDSLPDVPTFEPYPPGLHQVKLTWAPKMDDNNKQTGYTANFELVQTKELADPAGKIPEPGSKTGVLFQFNNDYGLGGFKEALSVLKTAISPTAPISNMELVAKSEGMEVLILSNIRKGKKGTDAADREYMSVVKWGIPG